MGLASGKRHERTPQQLSIVRHVLPDYGFRPWLTDLKHALAGRVCVSPVVEGLTVEVANLSVVGGIKRLQSHNGRAMPESGIEELNGILVTQKPSVAARVRNPYAPLYVREGELRLGFLVDPELLRYAASAALAAYRSEVPVEYTTFKPLDELGELTLGPVGPVSAGGAYRQDGFSSEDDLQDFCGDPNGYLVDVGAAIVPLESLALGPMRVAVSRPQAPQELARQASR